ncbi:MAG: molybdate ABC transporter permease subunit [Rubrivivax sp.]
MPDPLAEPALRSALVLSAQISALTLLVHATLGTALAAALARRGWRGRWLLDVLVTLPLVFPPVATGFLLLWLLGRHGMVGAPLREHLGLDFVFSFSGVLLASVLAGLPLVVKPVQAALESAAARLGEAARTLGKNEWQILVQVLLPATRRALAAGLALGLARSVGEVGITLMLGGNVEGRTTTVSLAIYNAVMGGEFAQAALLSALLGAVALAVFAALRRLEAL